MGDLTSSRLIWIKGFLFLILGLLAAGLLILRTRDLTIVFLLGISVWAFCRFYYFAFYVIEHYLDAGYKFASLTSFLRYVWSRKANRPD